MGGAGAAGRVRHEVAAELARGMLAAAVRAVALRRRRLDAAGAQALGLAVEATKQLAQALIRGQPKVRVRERARATPP